MLNSSCRVTLESNSGHTSAFQRVLNAFVDRQEFPQASNRGGRPPVSAEKHLGNQEPFRAIADPFNVAESCAYNCVRRVCRMLKSEANRLIVWPRGERARNVFAGFEAQRGIPGVMGAIDGSHIRIRVPLVFPENYVNRKGFYSIVLQAVCDHEMMFTDCHVGWPGSVHDARVLNNSDLESSHPDKFQGGSFIIGDSAYPLKAWLMTPYKDYGNLTDHQRNYNFLHSSTRMVIERSFAILNGRFKKLKYMDMKVEHIPQAVIAACVLHNLCIVNGDDLDDFLEAEENDVNHYQNIFPNDVGALNKREELVQYLANV